MATNKAKFEAHQLYTSQNHFQITKQLIFIIIIKTKIISLRKTKQSWQKVTGSNLNKQSGKVPHKAL